MSLDAVVAYRLWKKPLPAWLRATFVQLGHELREDLPTAALVEALANDSFALRRRVFRFEIRDTWIALRLAAIGTTVVATDRCATEDARAMCVALHEARLVDGLRSLFRLRVSDSGTPELRRNAISIAQNQATRYLTHLIPLAAQPSVSWEWRLLCASPARPRPT